MKFTAGLSGFRRIEPGPIPSVPQETVPSLLAKVPAMW